jgi:hypothetical protein
MATQVSKRLFMAPTGTGTGSTVTLYTCPSGRKARVTHVHFVNTGASSQAVSMSVDNGSVAANIASGVQVIPNDPGKDFFSSPGYVLNAGDHITCAYGNTISIIGVGFEEIVE